MIETIQVLITVKTYPIPSKKYDELVCTAGVTDTGDFIRLYPVNFRELPFDQQYKKYQWIEVKAEKHRGRDARKESYRPVNDSIRMIGEPIDTRDNWTERGKYVLKKKSKSMEALYEQQEKDRTSLGILRPKKIHDIVISEDDPDWKPSFLEALNQQRLFEKRHATLTPPRKVPYKFHYLFECDDHRCGKNHKMMIEDWEVGALYWKLIDKGIPGEKAAIQVRDKFLHELCGPDRDPHFYVGTILAYPKTWVIIGVFWPKKEMQRPIQEDLFQ